MNLFDIDSNSLEFSAALSPVALNRWSDRTRLAGELLDAFGRWIDDLRDVRVAGIDGDIGTYTASVRLQRQVEVTLQPDRLQLVLKDFVSHQMPAFLEVVHQTLLFVGRGSATPTLAARAVTYRAHGRVRDVGAATVLERLARIEADVGGDPVATGFTFHRTLADLGGEYSLTLDRSLRIADGLFVEGLLVVRDRDASVSTIASAFASLLGRGLGACQVEFADPWAIAP
jgi:hypothetical protein